MNLSSSTALSPALLDSLLAHAPAAIATLDHQGRILSLSASFTRIFGYTIEDIPHIDYWWSLAYPEPDYRQDRQSVWMGLMHAAIASASEIHNFEGHVHCKDGRHIWVEAHASVSASEFFIMLVDISARKVLEDDRRQTEWLDLALTSASSGIWEWQQDTDTHYWSREAHRLFGMEDQPPSFLQWERRIHPDDRHATLSAIRTAVASQQPFEAEYRLQIPDGPLRWILVRGKPVVSDGAGVRYLGVVLDITARHREQERMRILAQTFEQSQNAIIVTDPRMIITYVNPAFSRILGYTNDEVIGQPSQMFVADTTPPETVDRLATAITAGQAWEGDFHNRRKDGRIGIDYSHIFPVRDLHDRISHYVVIQMDVTAIRHQELELERHRKNLESLVEDRTEALRAAEQKYRMIADFTYDWETWNSPSGDYLYSSPSCLRITGHAASAFSEDPTLLFRIAHPDDAEMVRAHFAEHEVESCGQRQMEFRIIDTQGRERWLEHICRPVRNESGALLGFRASNRDITERKAADAERESARRAAERLTRLKTEFLANMSHEIRTPLNGVLGLAQVGHRQSTDGSVARDTFARIMESGHLLLAVINDILDFSKIEAGKLPIEAIPYSPRSTAQQALDSMIEAATAKGLMTCSRFATDLPVTCLGDPVRIKQILLNLLSNAIKFSDEGTVSVTTGLRDGQLIYSVTDNGIGISQDVRERLFHAFEQGDSSTTRRFGGTGLGLAISDRLARLMGGSLTVSSTPGAGSCFELSMPCGDIRLRRHEASTELSQAQPGNHRLKGTRILLADDNEIGRLVLQSMLSGEGAQVTLAENGRQAVGEVEATPDAFDIVLMDVQMPEVDGRTATREIHRIVPTLPVIGQTAHVLADELRECIEAGMIATIGKPIGHDDLVHLVLRHLPSPSTCATTTLMFSEPPACGCVAALVDWSRLHASHAAAPELVGQLLSVALERHADTGTRLREFAEAGKFDDVRRIAHSLKGTAGHFFAQKLLEAARRVEAAILANDEGVHREVDALAKQFDAFMLDVRSYSASHSLLSQ